MPISKFCPVLDCYSKGCLHSQHNRVCWPSVLLFGCFLGIISFFSKFWHVARNLHEVVHDRAEFSRGKKKLENGSKMVPKQGFLNLVKNLVINFYWIYSIIMKICIICCVPAQILYLAKFCSWNMCENVLSQSDSRIFLINCISRTNHWNNLIFCMLIQIHMN